MPNHYLQQETGAFHQVGYSDLATAPSTTFILQNFSANISANSTSTTTAFTLVPGCTLLQGSSGTWLVTGYASFIDTASAIGWTLRITDATTASTSVNVIAVSRSGTALAGAYNGINVSGIATSPTSQLTLQYAPVAATTTSIISATSTGGPAANITAVRIG